MADTIYSSIQVTKPGHVSADDCWQTILMLASQVERGRSIASAIDRIEMTIHHYRTSSADLDD